MIQMGTTRSSESQELINYLRSQRTTTQHDVDVIMVVHDSHDLTPSEQSAILTTVTATVTAGV